MSPRNYTPSTRYGVVIKQPFKGLLSEAAVHRYYARAIDEDALATDQLEARGMHDRARALHDAGIIELAGGEQ